MKKLNWKETLEKLNKYDKANTLFVFDFDGTLFSYPYLSRKIELPDYDTWTLQDIKENGYLGKYSFPNKSLVKFALELSPDSIACLSTVQTSFEMYNKKEAMAEYFPYIFPQNQWFVANDNNKALVLNYMTQQTDKKIIMIDDSENVFFNMNDSIEKILVERYI